MSENLLAVLIGGTIASVFPIINIFIDHRRWKKREKIRYLENQKEELLKLYKRHEKNLYDSFENNEFEGDLVSDFLIRFPKNVSDVFKKALYEKNKNKEKFKDYSLNIQLEMRKSLKDIDNQIKAEFEK
ncbi:MAG TPA: hypothetical protein PLI45_03075 [Candidatus Woesebacteria bacterium]|nr:hypothetical protein [Candidatus Woesebacteria bacterium]